MLSGMLKAVTLHPYPACRLLPCPLCSCLQLQSGLRCPPAPPLHAAVCRRCFPPSCCKVVLQNRETRPCESRSASEAACRRYCCCRTGPSFPAQCVCVALSGAGVAGSGGGPAAQHKAGAGWGLHLACANSSCPGTSDSGGDPSIHMCRGYGGVRAENAGGNSPSAFAVPFPASRTGTGQLWLERGGLVCPRVIKTAVFVRL